VTKRSTITAIYQLLSPLSLCLGIIKSVFTHSTLNPALLDFSVILLNPFIFCQFGNWQKKKKERLMNKEKTKS